MFLKIKKWYQNCIITLLLKKWNKKWDMGYIEGNNAQDWANHKFIITPLRKENEELKKFIKNEIKKNKDKNFHIRVKKLKLLKKDNI